jgi:hypothetical protein
MNAIDIEYESHLHLKEAMTIEIDPDHEKQSSEMQNASL